MKRRGILLTTLFWVALLAIQAHAQAVPQLINYQGRLTNPQGEGLSGTESITFNIYNAATGGTLIWGPKTFDDVPLVNGYFNVILGQDNSGNDISDAFEGPSRYIGITYNGNEITPRQQILAAPYAFTVNASGVKNTIQDSQLEEVIDREGFNASGDISADGDLSVGGQLLGGHRRKTAFPGDSAEYSFQWTVASGVHRIYVYAVGAGGGGGGGSAYSDDWAGGGGGAGGSYAGIPIDVGESYILDITIGAGGEGGNSGEYGAPGQAGGATTISIKDSGGNEIRKLVANGGGGGRPGRSSYNSYVDGSWERLVDAAGGTGGAPHGSAGNNGGGRVGGTGAHSLFGLGGVGGGSISGGDLNGYPGGAGAGGGGAFEGPGGRKGGKGGDGYVEIYY